MYLFSRVSNFASFLIKIREIFYYRLNFSKIQKKRKIKYMRKIFWKKPNIAKISKKKDEMKFIRDKLYEEDF